ncbi:hypothetical protein NC651_036769 [Populus alba x Populus x berolinensis]|nr:hypothetical protein NC651_036769 [Populus alba x Populus x berolinensis]
MHVIQSKTCKLDYLICGLLSISYISTFITHKEHQERSFKHIQDKLKKISDMILVLYIKKKTSIRYGHKSVANEKLVTLLS